MRTRSIATMILATAAACDRGTISRTTSHGSVTVSVPRVVINEILANPRAIPDERGEWVELRNLEAQPIDLRGWTIASGNDRGVTIDRSVALAANGILLLARDAGVEAAGLSATYVYGAAIMLGNNRDWIALRLPDGRTVDSVAWTSAAAGVSRALRDASAPHADAAGAAWTASSTPFGRGDLGTPAARTSARLTGQRHRLPKRHRSHRPPRHLPPWTARAAAPQHATPRSSSAYSTSGRVTRS